MEEKEKVFFIPGDIVTLKHDIPNKPIMIVKVKESKMIKHVDESGSKTSKEFFKGIRCFWFSDAGVLQEHVFNTKDLIKLK